MKQTHTAPAAFIGAMETEVRLLIAALENCEKVTLHGVDFYTGILEGTPAVVVRCGIGKVNAAITTQTLIDRFAPGCIVNTGIAGGVGAGLAVGDVVIGTKLAEHDFDLTPLGYAKGNVCEGDKTKPTFFEGDAALIDSLVSAAKTADPDRGVKTGVIVSGDVFVADRALKKKLAEDFGALAAEMEGASVAHTAAHAGVPFAVLRVISDLADGSASDSFTDFEEETAAHSSAVIRAFAKAARI